MNLLIDRSNRLANEWCWEWHYIMSIFRLIEKQDNEEYQYIFTDNLQTLPVQANKNTIVIIVSDEHYTIPKYAHEVKAIFKNYVFPEQEILNIYPIPQGYNKDLIFYPYKKISERKYDIAFQGNFHTSRPFIIKNILNEIEKRNLNLNILLKESQSAFEYSNNLCDTKISLCLDGQITPENFRFFESSILGCAILASDTLPKNWIYDQTHYIKVNWKDPIMVVNNIENLLNNNLFLEEMSKNSSQAWENFYSPSKIANYILSKLNNI
jgi:hypothetical protein